MIKKFISASGIFTGASRMVTAASSRIIIVPSLIMLLAAACSDPHTFKKAEDAQDAGREFIRASLDGNYEKASFYLFADSVNRMLLSKWKKDYDQLGDDVQRKYKDAEIMPIEIQAKNDSVTSYTYANSYKKDTTTIRIVRISGEWLVDLKEILNHKK
ncbi:MAG TPA: hypothetical protein VK563_02750 [Puia sp.]|nr:hypothetical protein [Puia sp.]